MRLQPLPTFYAFMLLLTVSTQAFIYETPDEFSLAADYNNDAILDLILVNRSTGQVTAGYSQADGSFIWQEPQTSGVHDVAAVTYGTDQEANITQLILTTPSLNRAQSLTADSSVPIAFTLPGFGHSMIITVGDMQHEFQSLAGMITSMAGNQVQVQTGTDPLGFPDYEWVIEGRQTGLTRSDSVALLSASITTTWRGAHGNDLGVSDLYIWREDNPNGIESRLRIAGQLDGGQAPDPEQASIVSLATLSISGAAADYVIAQNGSADAHAHWLFTWNRHSTGAHFYPATLSPSPSIGAGSTHVMAQTIDSIILITRPAAPPQVAFILDHGSLVKIYDFDGTTLTLQDTLIPGSGRHASGLVPWRTDNATGGFTLLERTGTTGPSTHTTRYARDASGHYAPAGTDALPQLAKLAMSNIFLWQSEPMVEKNAQLVGLRRAGDWTSSVNTTLAGTQATAETFISSPQGLTNPALRNAGANSEKANHVTGNQISSSLSLFSYEPALGDKLDVAVKYAPVPGRYTGESLNGASPTLKVTLSFHGGGYFSNLLYRLNGGAWQIVTVMGEFPTKTLTLTGDTIIESMSYTMSSSGGFGGGIGGFAPPSFSRIYRAAYFIGPAPEPPASGTDGNGNGLIDEWERLLGVSDPTADDDGDGQSNFAEHNAGTDPHDATEFYTPPATLPVLSLRIEPSASGPCICATWPTDDPSVRLEASTTLGAGATWSPPTTGILIEGSQFVYRTQPPPGQLARFFRLARY